MRAKTCFQKTLVFPRLTVRNIVILLTFQLHPAAEALVEAAGGALLARGDGDGAAAAAQAHVVLAVLHRALEEALARLAREDAVVEAADLVAADRTRAAHTALIYPL